MRRSLPLLVALFLLLCLARPTGAQESELDVRTRELAERLQCTVCNNLSIQDSNSAFAEDAKTVIRRKLAAGESEAQIEAYFVRQYGEGILLEPSRRGFNLLIWAQPVLVLLVGLVIIGAAASRWTRPKPPGTSGPGRVGPAGEAAQVSDADLERYDGLLREELRRRREREA